MLSVHFNIIPDIALQQLCLPFSSPQLPSDVLPEPRVTSAEPGPDPLCTHTQCTGTMSYRANLMILGILADIYICIDFIPSEGRIARLLTPL